MYTSLLSISLLLSIAASQSTTSTTSGTTSVCAAQPVLEACLASTQAIAAGCASTDYGCLCSKYAPIVTCFQQCPNDPRYSSIYSDQQTYCADASVYSSATSTPISMAVSSGTAAVTSGSSTSGGSTATTTSDSGAVATASKTSSSAAASATGKSGAGNIMVSAGGLIMGLAGFVGVML